ncbi:MAG: ROK family protein, partial [Anaerolineae bacterium]
MAKHYIVVDLGGTQIRAALATSPNRLYQTIRMETLADQGPDVVIRRLESAVRQVAGETWADVDAIGIVSPGPLDPWLGVILEAPNLPGWENLPLKDRLSSSLNRPVVLGNDANFAALAEQRFGAGQGKRHMIYITVSTGIGGGVIIDDKLLLGVGGLAAEVGHMTLEPYGPLCTCGNRGCLEALASGPAIARDARDRIAAGQASSILPLAEDDPQRITAELVGRAATQGDPLAIELLQQAGFYIGVGIVNLMNLFNPGIIVIGGGVSQVGNLLFEPIRQTVQARIGHFYWENCPIVPAAL